MVIYFEGLAPVKSHGFLSRGLVKSRGKLKKISTIIMSVATSLTWWWLIIRGVPSNNARWSFIYVALWSSMTNQIGYIFICSGDMAHKLGKMVTYCERVQHLNSHDLAMVK